MLQLIGDSRKSYMLQLKKNRGSVIYVSGFTVHVHVHVGYWLLWTNTSSKVDIAQYFDLHKWFTSGECEMMILMGCGALIAAC